MNDSRIFKADGIDDPERCQYANCTNKGLVDSDDPTIKYPNCLVHGGNKQEESRQKNSVRNYKLEKWKFANDFERHCTSPRIKDLRDEIGLLRMLMEERLKMCTDAHQLMMWSGPIMELASRIEKIVSTCNKLEKSMGQHLDKTTILSFASGIINIISENIAEPQIVEKIANEILELVASDD